MRIGVDVDSVLADIMEPLLDFFNKKKGRSLVIEDIKYFNLEKDLGISFEETINLVDDFFVECFNDIEPVEGSVENVKLLKDEGHELCIITARPNQFKENTIGWLKEVYGEETFTEFFFNDKFRDPDAKPKSEIIISNNIEVLIDDDITNYLDCSSKGIPCILLNANNKFPWSRTDDPEFVKAFSWNEIVQKIDSLIVVKNQ